MFRSVCFFCPLFIGLSVQEKLREELKKEHEEELELIISRLEEETAAQQNLIQEQHSAELKAIQDAAAASEAKYNHIAQPYEILKSYVPEMRKQIENLKVCTFFFFTVQTQTLQQIDGGAHSGAG
jgi:hypothetical protein